MWTTESPADEVITPVLLSAGVTGSLTEESDLDSALLQRCSLTPRKNVSLCVRHAARVTGNDPGIRRVSDHVSAGVNFLSWCLKLRLELSDLMSEIQSVTIKEDEDREVPTVLHSGTSVL